MRKVLRSILVIVLLGIMMCTTCYASSTVTKEQFKKGIEASVAEGEGMVLKEMTDDVITLGDEENTLEYNINYTLDSNPKFSMDMIFTKDMTFEEYGEEMAPISMLTVGFAGVAYAKGQTVKDALAYSIFAIMSSGDVMQESDYTDAISLVEKYLGKNFVEDDLFTITLEEVSKTDSELAIKAILEVKAEEDFSTLKGYTNDIGNDIIGDMTNSLIEENDIVYSNTIANIEKIPQSGKEFGITDILQILILISAVTLVIFIIKDKRVK